MAGLPNLFRVDGQIALVTGGAGNLGHSLCTALAEAGATVICAGRDLEKAQAVAREVTTKGGICLPLAMNLADPHSINRAMAELRERHGGVDLLINNAISQFPGRLENLSPEDWSAAMAVDSDGFFRVTQACLQDMLVRGRGNIISIASVLGMVAAEARLYPKGLDSFRPNYFFVKAGVVGFTRYVATAYADQGIRANCISPGGIEPRGGAPNTPFADRVPMKRLARPDEMQGALLYLASEASSYVTGHNLVVDGGYTAW